MALFGEELVTRTKFIAPAVRRTHLPRERLGAALARAAEEGALTLVVAGAGYGKSTLLAQALGDTAWWYELGERDADPQVLMLHLAHRVHRAMPGAADRALALLALPGGAARHGKAAVEALADALVDRLEQPTWLVLDDFHLLADAPEARALVNHLVASRPPRLHVVLASRTRPDLPDLPRWRLEGAVTTLTQADMAFRPDELAHLLGTVHGLAVTPELLTRLATETEGWPMAAQLLAGRLRDDPEGTVAQALAGHSLTDLFAYWAREVLDRLEAPAREFLLATAPLTRLEAPLCDALTGGKGALARLDDLNGRGLFLVPLGPGRYRHHHLFREFLLATLEADGKLVEAHRAAARVTEAAGQGEEAVGHWLAAGESAKAASAMVALAPALAAGGRTRQLDGWLARLDEALIDATPGLALAQGEACRATARYEEAIAWYRRAEARATEPAARAWARARQAQVFLDTLQPARAEALLAEALAEPLTDADRAAIQTLWAENRLNQGDAPGAERLFAAAASAGGGAVPAEQASRVLLRTGRLAEARALCRAAVASAGPDPEGATQAHRDPMLVLSLVSALVGDVPAAREMAERGLARARRQHAPWAEAAGLMRLGHAALVGGELDEAEGLYRDALALAHAIGVPRLKAEPLWGLALAAGRRGALADAEAHAREGLAIAQDCGDVWFSGLLGLALGAAYARAGDPRAERWLMQAETSFGACGDAFGLVNVALWSAVLARGLGEARGFASRVRALLDGVRRNDHGFLLAKPTLLGFGEPAEAAEFARAAIASGLPAALVASAVGEATSAEWGFLRPVADGDGPMLRVRCLGSFRVWRGGESLGERAFGREKARALFHLLLTYRGQWLPKGRLIDLLWPELDAASADGTFRVALNALNKTLEPGRKGGEPARFVIKQGANYGLAEHADLWLDVSAFERGLDEAAMLESAGQDATEAYAQALALNEGPFLGEFAYTEPWLERERERLADRFSQGALRLAKLLLARGDFAGAAEWAQRLIAREPCSEDAFRVLMAAQYEGGDRALAIRTYDRLVITLDDELDVDPMPETQALYARITKAERARESV